MACDAQSNKVAKFVPTMSFVDLPLKFGPGLVKIIHLAKYKQNYVKIGHTGSQRC